MADSRNYSYKKLTKSALKIERQSRTILFLGSTLVSILFTLLLQNDSFTTTQSYVLFLLFLSVGLWITEAVPPFAVGIMIIGFLVFTIGKENEMDAKKYVQTWSDGVMWILLGGFFIAQGMKKAQLDTKLLSIAAPKFGKKQPNVLLGLMLITAILSMLMSNTATTAMMLAACTPLIAQLGNTHQLSKSILLGIPVAASVGGMGTIIGSAPNAIAIGALNAVGVNISFFQWMIIGFPVALFIVFIFWKILIRKYQLTKTDVNFDFTNQDTTEQNEALIIEDAIKKRIVISVTLITLLLWLSSQWTNIPVAAISGIPIIGFTLLGIIDADDVRSLPWDTLVLVAGGLALGLAIQEQGLAKYFVDFISQYSINLYFMMFIFAFLTVIASNFMSNTAAATIFIPLALSIANVNTGFNVMILPLVIGLSASCAFLLPVSTPPNAIAFSTGFINQKEFRLPGISIGIIGPLLIILWVMLYVFFVSTI